MASRRNVGLLVEARRRTRRTVGGQSRSAVWRFLVDRRAGDRTFVQCGTHLTVTSPYAQTAAASWRAPACPARRPAPPHPGAVACIHDATARGGGRGDCHRRPPPDRRARRSRRPVAAHGPLLRG